MDWDSLIEQLQKMDALETQISLPVTGVVLASRLKLAITSCLNDLNKVLKQATGGPEFSCPTDSHAS